MSLCAPAGLVQLTLPHGGSLWCWPALLCEKMEVSVLGWLLVSTWTGLLAAGNPREHRGAATVLEGTEADPSQDRPVAWTGAWTEQRDEALRYHDYFGGSDNLIGYSRPSTQLELVTFRIYDEVTMYELSHTEPNSTRNRCRGCCTPTTCDPERQIMRKEEEAWPAVRLNTNSSITVWTQSEVSGLERSRTGVLKQGVHPPTERCAGCCLLHVVQKIELVETPWWPTLSLQHCHSTVNERGNHDAHN